MDDVNKMNGSKIMGGVAYIPLQVKLTEKNKCYNSAG